MIKIILVNMSSIMKMNYLKENLKNSKLIFNMNLIKLIFKQIDISIHCLTFFS